MPSRKLTEELDRIASDFRSLGARAQSAVGRCARALRGEPVPDAGPDESAALAAACGTLVEECQHALLIHHPMAADFRRVTAVLRAAGDLERLGERAVAVARAVGTLPPLPGGLPRELGELAELAADRTRAALAGYDGGAEPTESDPERAHRLTVAVASRLASALTADPGAARAALAVAAVAHELREVLYHADALSQEVPYLTAGFSPAPAPRVPDLLIA